MKNPNFTAVFFDWGGVVANDPGDEFLGDVLRNVGATDAQVAKIFETYMQDFMRGHISEAAYWQALRTNYGLTIPKSISDEFKKWRGLVANDDVLALASDAKSRGFNIAILSNVIEPTYNVIQDAGYYNHFDQVIASCKEGYIKPEPDIYRIALGRLGVTAAESIFIDDKQYCLDPAAQMGFTTVLARTPEQIIHDVRSLLAIP